MLPTLLVIVTGLLLYWFPMRRWMSRWGTTPSDLTRVMAGDSLLVNPTYSGMMAVIVNAAPEHIWPWLVQIGYSVVGCTATTGSIACSAISIVRVPLAFSRSFRTSLWVTRFPSVEAQAGRWQPSSRIARLYWT